MRHALLALRDIEKQYSGFRLGPVSTTLAPGRVYGLLGPNGAGKTTLLNIVSLQARPTSGSMWYGERRIEWHDAWWKSRFAYVRENPWFYPELTVRRTLRLASLLYPKWNPERARRLATAFDLPLDDRVKALSKGTRVKLGLVAALAHQAEFVFLDEPTAGLDPDAREEFYAVVRELRAQQPGVTVVVSSHIFQDLEALAENVLILRHGRLVRCVTGGSLTGPELEALYRDTAVSARESA